MYLIFDFDGTIVNSFCNVVEKFNLLADEFNFREISETEIEGLRNLNSRAVIKFLKIPLYKLPKVIKKARKFMHEDVHLLGSYANLPDVLRELSAAGIPLGILTSNSHENVSKWLAHNQLEDLFSFIHVESNFFGKKHSLKRIMRKYTIKKAHAFYVGDETRDIDAARQCGINAVAVTWGFNSEQVLLKHKPHFLVREPSELLEIHLKNAKTAKKA
jgi:phosphoglycolate phosphatase